MANLSASLEELNAGIFSGVCSLPFKEELVHLSSLSQSSSSQNPNGRSISFSNYATSLATTKPVINV